MKKVLLSGLPKHVQCSLNKNETYKLNVLKYIALDKYTFIQVRHDDFHKFIIIDIDSRDKFKTSLDILNKLNENNITLPYCIIKTNKGWHIWWILEQPVFRNNRKQMYFYNKIKIKLNKLLDGDTNFSGFIARNPLLHDTEYILQNYVSFNDFLTKEEFITNKIKKIEERRRKIVYTNIDLTKVKIGERNKKLLKYLRTYAFIYFKELNIDKFIDIGLNKNNLLPNPLETTEVVDMCKSIFKWVEKEYKDDYNKSYINNRNRLLAKQKKNNTKLKVFSNLIKSLNDNTISFYNLLNKKYSLYFLAKVLKVDRKTIKKYFNLFKQYYNSFLNKKDKFIHKLFKINILFENMIKQLEIYKIIEFKPINKNERWKQLYGT